MFRTITARYAGSICKRCRKPIEVGDRIRYGGYGRTYHLSASCDATQTQAGFPTDKPQAIEGELVTDPAPMAVVRTKHVDDYPAPPKPTPFHTRGREGFEEMRKVVGSQASDLAGKF
jgi:hypothetical protein